MIKRKGIMTAALACNEIGKKLIIAGQGAMVREDGHLVATSNSDFDLPPGTWEYYGFADVEARKKLMAGAIATFTPTEYQEIFGGTHVESRLSGTPVLTTDFGVFSNTFDNGVDGYKCHTLDDFVWGAKESVKLDHALIRKRAERYDMNVVKWEFMKWFEDLYFVYESAFYSNKKGWHRIRKSEPEWRKNIYYNNP
jgi:glycosyltransferase involved in cell wall biosynthesis